MMEAYDTTFLENPHYIEPAEEANIAPLIQSSMYDAIQKSETEQSYSVLCILTAGKLAENLAETIDTVCTAAEDAPLSVVIIGVGDNQEEFEEIKLLLANGGKLRHSNGVPIARDIVTFASLDECGDAEQVVAEGLKDIPEQFVEYFTHNGIEPHPPLSKDESMSSSSMKDGSKSTSAGGSRRRREGRGRAKKPSRSPTRARKRLS